MKKSKKIKVIKKTTTIAICIIMTVLCCSISASAASVHKTYKGSFSRAWERYASGDKGKASLTYGFDTFLINEDYAWAKHSTKSHYAAIKNGKGWHTATAKSAKKVSKVEVMHRGCTVSYYCYY